eukprot:TRINITY_DN32701_c1_g1_i1.p1 TRINITY_DN32701_c1_g1~~TRINITY_DN32701_c1_g1_i1.p1  ORF type:complete len:246 (+),score=27.49 TRINITY_DN32701_c1_g1_i1:453-1190(+)
MRLMLGDGCFLVRKQFDPNDNTGSENRPLQWDILYGSYEIEDGVATCSWHAHVQRRIEYNLQITQKLGDSGWEKMDERASFKWRRLEVSDRTRTSLLEEMLASMTPQELCEAIQEDMRSNGVPADWMYSDEDLMGPDGCIEELRHDLIKLYKGEGLTIKFPRRLHMWSALIPGKLLGVSHCWTRLREYEEQLASQESDAYSLPGLDFSQSCLLGIKLTEIYEMFRHTIKEMPDLDLSDLPQLLGL